MWGEVSVLPTHTHKAAEHGKKSHEVENKDRGWTSEVEVLSVLPPATGGHHMSKRKHACEWSDDRSTVVSSFL